MLVLGHLHLAEVERVEGTAAEINLSPDRPLVALLQDQGLDAHAVGQGRVPLLRDQGIERVICEWLYCLKLHISSLRMFISGVKDAPVYLVIKNTNFILFTV